MVSADSSKLGVVLVHGAWHTPSHWANVTAKLQKDGFQVETPQLVSSNTVAVEGVFAKDVAVIKQAIQKVTTTGKNAALVLHSYAGMCGSDAIAEFFEDSRANPQPGHGTTLHALYVCATIIPKGMSLADDKNTPHIFHLTEQGMAYNLQPFDRFYQLTDPKLAFESIQKLNAQNLESFLTPQKWSGWSDYGVPVTYIAAKQDNAVVYDPDLLKFQQRLKDTAKDCTLHTLDSDHTPWFSKEAEFFAILDEVLVKASGKAQA